jgi:hypothetical protein
VNAIWKWLVKEITADVAAETPRMHSCWFRDDNSFFLATTSHKSCLKNNGPPATWCSPDILWCTQSLATPFLKLISLTSCYICLWILSKELHVCEMSVCWWSVSRQPLIPLEAREIEIVIANKSSRPGRRKKKHAKNESKSSFDVPWNNSNGRCIGEIV